MKLGLFAFAILIIKLKKPRTYNIATICKLNNDFQTSKHNSTKIQFPRPQQPSPIVLKTTMHWRMIKTWINLVFISLSAICLIAQLYKFLRRSAFTQSFITKTLTLYCVILLSLYIVEYTPASKIIFIHPSLVDIYLIFTTVFFKFVILLEICLYFRHIAQMQQPPSGSQNEKLVVYFLSAVCTPLLLVYVILLSAGGGMSFFSTSFSIVEIIRLAYLVPILGAFWFIRSAKIDKTQLWSDYSLHIRLLIVIGAFTSLLEVVEFVHPILVPGFYEGLGTVRINRPGKSLEIIGTVVEGLLIGIFFTFKADTFRPVADSESIAML